MMISDFGILVILYPILLHLVAVANLKDPSYPGIHIKIALLTLIRIRTRAGHADFFHKHKYAFRIMRIDKCVFA